MRQILFYVPLHLVGLPDLPVFGYGVMLMLAFFGCSWLASRLARREHIDPKHLADLTFWIFGFGLIGARIVFVTQEPARFRANWVQFFYLWDGGLVFYGSLLGGVVGFALYYALYLRKHHVPLFKMMDVIAPCIALGLALGRVGCLFTGCCYGNAAGPDCPGICFPLPAAPTMAMIVRGHQTMAGFTLAAGVPIVERVEPNSPAEYVGLRAGDLLVKLNDTPLTVSEDFLGIAHEGYQRNERDLVLTIRRGAGEVNLPPFQATSIPVHPTQIYESISMALLLFLLLTYYPYKAWDGSVLVLWMTGYAVHRFLNEMLRTDTAKVLLDMTLSQNISIAMLAAAAGLAICSRASTTSSPRLTPK